MNTQIALTGRTGYFGRCFLEYVLNRTDWDVISLQRSFSPDQERVTVLDWDFREEMRPEVLRKLERVKYFVHAGAEVHAKRSLTDPGAFVQGNAVGTFHALEVARRLHLDMFVYISTAEVLGGRVEGYSGPEDVLRPSNPYSASKAAAEMLVYSYYRTFMIPAIIVRTMNMYGPTQNDVSKFIPMVEKILLEGGIVPIHVNDQGHPGVRQWIRGEEFATKVLSMILQGAKLGRTYHVVGEEKNNWEVVREVAARLGVDCKATEVPMPPTHEFRYALKSFTSLR